MAGNDWVVVRLTAFGAKQAGNGVLRVSEGNGGQGFEFKPGVAQRVTRAYDWERVLKPWHHHGHALFETVETPEEAVEELRELGIHATATPSAIEVETLDVPEVK